MIHHSQLTEQIFIAGSLSPGEKYISSVPVLASLACETSVARPTVPDFPNAGGGHHWIYLYPCAQARLL